MDNFCKVIWFPIGGSIHRVLKKKTMTRDAMARMILMGKQREITSLENQSNYVWLDHDSSLH